MNTEIELKLPNYRIYDRTGGGVTHDIYTETLEDAIEVGREWIAEGDWERDEMETPLDCCVREIVRVPDLRSIEALPGVWGAGVLPDAPQLIIVTVDDDALSTIIAAKMLPGTITLTIPDNDGSTILHIDYGHPLPMMIDSAATADGQSWDCSGVCPAKDAPACVDGCEHDWQSPYEVVGGCRENPGVWGSGHGTIKETTCCARCGLLRTIDYGATLPSNGQQATRISYEEDNEVALAWARPSEVKVNGVTVALDWNDMTATHTVPAIDLRDGISDGPSDGETIDLPSGKTITLGQHDYSTDQPGNENDEECTCSTPFSVKCDSK